MAFSSMDSSILQAVAKNLGVSSVDLKRLIQFESGWNPAAKNPYSSARGLLQWTDKTAQSLGYTDSLDLVKKNPTITDQLTIVEKYLAQFKPFSSKQSLYLSVFYPAARNWNTSRLFPEAVRSVNPGVNTPGDYINLVEGKKKGGVSTVALIAILLAVTLYHFTKRKG